EGEGKSRGFGFVAFSEHRHALACLQALNNNPQTFTDVKRPIVEFSIENMSALNIKRSRVEKSKQPMGAKRHTTATTAVGPIAAKRAKTDLDATKREIAAGGRKAFASHVGPKIRHRDKGKKAKRSDAPAPAGKKPKASASNKKSRKVVREEKAGRKSTSHAGSKRKMTKFLALS
uniref:RRM domain-containing protein n=1 Tax=Plectus sambesii TaxID=2011161 RepID=A0A914UHE8_9BILA